MVVAELLSFFRTVFRHLYKSGSTVSKLRQGTQGTTQPGGRRRKRFACFLALSLSVKRRLLI
jgi:hypothetical protein